MNISGKGWRASPPARHPTGRAQKNNPFCLVGPARPGPFKTGQKRAGPKRAGLARFDTPNQRGIECHWQKCHVPFSKKRSMSCKV